MGDEIAGRRMLSAGSGNEEIQRENEKRGSDKPCAC
jgi:hypothetical protein